MCVLLTGVHFLAMVYIRRQDVCAADWCSFPAMVYIRRYDVCC
jgi:hypothetical protein